MSIREQLNRSPVAAVVVTVIAIGIALVVLRGGRRQERSLQYDFFFELSSGKLIVADSLGVMAPIRDGQAVKAHVFACGDCSDPAKRQIGWLEKYDDAAHAAAAADAPDRQERIDAGRLLAAAPTPGQELTWVKFNSPAAAAVISAKSQRCPDREARAITCAPLEGELP